MKPRLSLLFVIAFITAPLCAAVEWEWCSHSQVEQIALATLLADFPLPQGRLQTVIGTRKLPHLGGSTDERGRVYGLVALTDPKSPGGYYAARIIYDLAEPVPKAEHIPIEAVEVVYISDNRMTFVYDAGKSMKHVIPELKKRMQEGGITPIGLAESFFKDDQEAKKPNHTAEPASPSRGGSS